MHDKQNAMECLNNQHEIQIGLRLEKEVDSCRSKVTRTPFCTDVQVLELYMDYMCGLTLLAEGHLNNQTREWEISTLAGEFLKYAPLLKGCRDFQENLYACASRISDVLFSHPRIKVRLLEFQFSIGELLEEKYEEMESLQEEIQTIRNNINYADKGQWDQIVQTGHLKVDPVEWTKEWEDVIDEVEKEVAGQLKDIPWRMGSCFEYWSTKKTALSRKEINWRSPSQMNPRVLFD